MRKKVVFLAAVVAVVATACSSGGSGTISPAAKAAQPQQPVRSAAPARTPEDALAAAFAAAKAQRWVHTEADTTEGSDTALIYGDTGPDRGVLTYALSMGRATFREVPSKVFFLADHDVYNQFGIPQDVWTKAAGRWLLIQRGQKRYDDFAGSFTLPGLLDQVRIVAPLTLLPARVVAGQRVIGVKGTASDDKGATATLWIAAHGTPLPVRYEEAGHGLTVSTSFSKWGRPVAVPIPADYVTMG